ncbi:glycosyltransferase [Erwinia sp. SLM-02]|uniref:glycosyltransferase n=1 Tax=Erwinia sp. SLM-02 TaxID=3020057 RepID=UPI00307FE627
MTDNESLPMLSVVIPVYNVSKYVIKAVDSVINQTIKPYEVIIVDDGSTDGSGELVKNHYSDLEFVKIIRTENQGLGEARNVGTNAATGDYIYYFDSDDLIENNLIENFYKALRLNSDIDIFAFSAESFPDDIVDNNHADSAWLPHYRRGAETVYESGEDAFNELSVKEAFYPNAWLYIYKRQLQVKHGLKFKPIIHEDEEFTPRLFFVAGKIVVTDQVFFLRRVRAGSIMQSARSEKNVIGYLKSIESLESLLSANENEVTKRNLRGRIISNILNIILIKRNSQVIFSDTTLSEYNLILSRNGNFLTKIASLNFFVYRVLNFGFRKFKA